MTQTLTHLVSLTHGSRKLDPFFRGREILIDQVLSDGDCIRADGSLFKCLKVSQKQK